MNKMKLFIDFDGTILNTEGLKEELFRVFT
jgi:hydroxymethylpyrimidine pyrophosphatase-like HAD family hydrolase